MDYGCRITCSFSAVHDDFRGFTKWQYILSTTSYRLHRLELYTYPAKCQGFLYTVYTVLLLKSECKWVQARDSLLYQLRRRRTSSLFPSVQFDTFGVGQNRELEEHKSTHNEMWKRLYWCGGVDKMRTMRTFGGLLADYLKFWKMNFYTFKNDTFESV